jgi:uncharacterized phage-associated protein
MSKEFNSLDVAAFIAQTCGKFNYSFNNTKIQKLLYCCYGCYLAAYSERLCDEYPRAWQYGPVFPRVFNHIHKNRPLPINNATLPGIDQDKKDFLEDVIKVFGQYNAVPLSEWTHKCGSPWYKVVHELDGGLNSFIPDDIIKDYFLKNVVEKINGSTH